MIQSADPPISKKVKNLTRDAAYQQALLLQRPENLSKLDPNYQKKIENLAKTPVEEPDPPQVATPCPFCGALVPEYET